MTDVSATDTASVVGVSVRGYKNLRDIWLPWSEGVAIFGTNGAGKTNLLECLALLMGTPETVWLARPRLERPTPEDISIIFRTGLSGLPWPPAVTAPWAALDARDDVGAEQVGTFVRAMPFFARAVADGHWWRALQVVEGDDFRAGVAKAGLPQQLAAYLAGLADNAVIKFGLEHIDLDFDDDIPQVINRRFTRTLVVPQVPQFAPELADALPDVFAPLRQTIAQSGDQPGGWIPLLELPPVDQVPAVLQWLARPRTDAEVTEAIATAFQRAAEPAAELLEVLGQRLPLAKAPEPGDAHWWLHELGARRGTAELAVTTEGVSIEAVGEYDADFGVKAGDDRRVGRTGTATVLDWLSASQRRWADEAMATTARELDSFGHRASLYAQLADSLDDDMVMQAALAVAETVETELAENDFWTFRSIDIVLQALEPVLRAIALTRLGPTGNPITRESSILSQPGLALVTPTTVVRVFDEPEAHLHPSAQRKVAAALLSLGNATNVVIASHSAAFLDRPGWTQAHICSMTGASGINVLGPDATLSRDRLARELGLSQGDLLSGIAALLFVEGPHDERILTTLFGSELRAAGVAVVCMYGVDRILGIAELDFLDRYLDVPIIVLVDHAQVDRLKHPRRPLTKEEHRLQELIHKSHRPERYTFVGLSRLDIVAYLNEDAVHELCPGFTGWRATEQAFRQAPSGSRFKEWLRDERGVDVASLPAIERVLDVMRRRDLKPAGELIRAVSETLAKVSGHTLTR